MDRVEKSKEKFEQIFGNYVPTTTTTDPDFQKILKPLYFWRSFLSRQP